MEPIWPRKWLVMTLTLEVRDQVSGPQDINIVYCI